MTGKRVLVTDGNYKHSLAAVRALSRQGYRVHVLGGSTCYSAASKHCERALSLPGSVTDESLAPLVELLSSGRYDVLMPIGAQSVTCVSRNRHRFAEHTALALASPESIDICLDKSSTARLANSLGIRTPRGVAWDPASPVDIQVEGLHFPLVVKGRNELTTRPVQYAASLGELRTHLERSADDDSERSGVLIQEYVEGPGEGFFAIYDNGECHSSFMHRRIREYPATGGSSCCAESICETDLADAGTRILSALDWHGVAMVEFKREAASGELVLMEINPKFWGSLDLAIDSGVDFPSLTARLALGQEMPASQPYRIGIRYQWPMEGDLQHARTRPSSAISVLANLMTPGVHKNIWRRDPRPTVGRVKQGTRDAARSVPVFREVVAVVGRSRRIGWRVALVRAWTEASGSPAIGYSRITDGIFIGAQQRAMGRRKLQRWGVRGTVNLRSELDYRDRSWQVGDYCWIPVDEFEAPTVEQLCEAVDFVRRINEEGGAAYIHCREGVSRAATVGAACLIGEGSTLEEALARIQRVRPFIDILPNQMRSLRAFEGDRSL